MDDLAFRFMHPDFSLVLYASYAYMLCRVTPNKGRVVDQPQLTYTLLRWVKNNISEAAVYLVLFRLDYMGRPWLLSLIIM